MRKFWIFVILLLLLAPPALAQNVGSGVAVSGAVDDQTLSDGTILCSQSGKLVACTVEYDSSMIGVVSLDPALYLQNTTQTTSLPMITSGKAYVRVSGANGAIAKGDLITSSTTAGVGEKAAQNGFVLGTAEEAFSGTKASDTDKIQVTLGIKAATVNEGVRGNLLDTLRRGLSSVYLTPLSALRYIFAMVVTGVTFTLGFVYFGRVARSGVEAIGRNPMAGTMIQASVVFNVILMIAIMLAGLGLAYLILVI